MAPYFRLLGLPLAVRGACAVLVGSSQPKSCCSGGPCIQWELLTNHRHRCRGSVQFQIAGQRQQYREFLRMIQYNDCHRELVEVLLDVVSNSSYFMRALRHSGHFSTFEFEVTPPTVTSLRVTNP